ncbi:unnamed protein product [Cuscuta epithymum]|uniref:DDE Tnp4 domain-containing protein n=1 Tax=Cuscuta epithymum TaxID=186058 RepID=A0AAV0FVE3_9ASTE|nr:unnamed protein product [Cuscuta epithymum]CAH9139646.1 unnamed protein product [Cuscuta epithymum]
MVFMYIVLLGKCFLVDCGFANRRQFLAPFRGVRYHLQDFGGDGRHPGNERELFNLRHASLRNVVERIFGIFKSRFAIFKSAPPFPFKTQAELVLACAGVHNYLRKECRADEFPVDSDDDEEDSTDPSLLEEVEEEMDTFQSQDEQRQHANQWRNDIAQNMWIDVTDEELD